MEEIKTKEKEIDEIFKNLIIGKQDGSYKSYYDNGNLSSKGEKKDCKKR